MMRWTSAREDVRLVDRLGTDTAIRDRLARQRTELANERTLLAYIRTALGFFIVGVPAVWWLDQPYAQILGVVSLTGGLFCLFVGIQRFIALKRIIDESPDARGECSKKG